MQDAGTLTGIRRIISGGQTGVDRGALNAALRLGLEHGGWCPQGRLAEDGTVPARYLLDETESPEYPVRTERNVLAADATLILYRQRMAGGTELTRRLAEKYQRPCLAVDLQAPVESEAIRSWLLEQRVVTLNVAGPRESSAPGIQADTEHLLVRVLNPILRR